MNTPDIIDLLDRVSGQRHLGGNLYLQQLPNGGAWLLQRAGSKAGPIVGRVFMNSEQLASFRQAWPEPIATADVKKQVASERERCREVGAELL